jgi:RNA polymerase sigma-70 factor (ECF subfamily)
MGVGLTSWATLLTDREAMREAIAVAYAAHHAQLVRRLTLIIGDPHEAQDVTHAAFERALLAIDRFDGADLRAWLWTIAVRLAINERRRRGRLHAFLRSRQPDLSFIAVDPDLWAALARLDPRTRAAIVLSVLDGYRYQEIGDMLDVPSGTVGSWITRGKAQLRAALDDEDEP